MPGKRTSLPGIIREEITRAIGRTGSGPAAPVTNFPTALAGGTSGGGGTATGISATVTLAKLTTGGTEGSLTFTDGLLTAATDAT